MEVLTAIFCWSPNLKILSARGRGADKKSKFGLGRRAVCNGFLEAHNPKSPKMGLGEVARGRSLNLYGLHGVLVGHHFFCGKQKSLILDPANTERTLPTQKNIYGMMYL